MSAFGMKLQIETIVAKPFEQNSYVLWLDGASQAIVVDPGFDPKTILSVLAKQRLVPAAILLTHGHADHIAGNEALKTAFPEAPLVIGENEAGLLADADLNLSAGYGFPIVSPAADRLVVDGEIFSYASISFHVREIPGHSPGSVVYLINDQTPPIVLGGDVLFAGSVGRTDLGGDFDTLAAGIREKLFSLPDETIVLSGHGPATTIGREKRTNPFVGINS